jgi:hypothetical protein
MVLLLVVSEKEIWKHKEAAAVEGIQGRLVNRVRSADRQGGTLVKWYTLPTTKPPQIPRRCWGVSLLPQMP